MRVRCGSGRRVEDRLMHLDLDGTLQTQDSEEVRQVINEEASIIHKSEACQSTDVLIRDDYYIYSSLRYDSAGQAKIVSQISRESMKE